MNVSLLDNTDFITYQKYPISNIKNQAAFYFEINRGTADQRYVFDGFKAFSYNNRQC